jgi:uncharacterized membrane protein YidH (DUF202 family)
VSRAGAGLAEERTSLAWSRSSLALLACGAAVFKGVPRLADPRGRPVAGAIVVALAALAAAVGSWTERSRRRSVARAAGAIEPRMVRRVALVNFVIGLAALALAALGP